MDNNLPKQAALTLLKQFKITSPSLDDLLNMLRLKEYEIIDYSKQKKTSNTNTLIEELSLQSFASAGSAFLYKNKEIKLVFVCEELLEQDKIYTLAHELGHIACDHVKEGCAWKANIQEEYEANEFAHYLLNPSAIDKTVIRISKHRLLATVLTISMFLALLSIPIISWRQRTSSYYGDYYVTETGQKYHAADCPAIRDKTNIHRLTIEEFESAKYEPCQICLADGAN